MPSTKEAIMEMVGTDKSEPNGPEAKPKLSKKEVREQRLAEELRANLKRRKAQDRGRRSEVQPPTSD